jgi:hypothetical protein
MDRVFQSSNGNSGVNPWSETAREVPVCHSL